MRRMYDQEEIKSIASESGGGKYYMHNVVIAGNDTTFLPQVSFKYISTDNTEFSLDKFKLSKCFDMLAAGNTTPPTYYEVVNIAISGANIVINYYTEYPYKVLSEETITISKANANITDKVIEL